MGFIPDTYLVGMFRAAIVVVLASAVTLLIACGSTPEPTQQSVRLRLTPGQACRANAPAPGTFEPATTPRFVHDAFPVPDPDEMYEVEDLSGAAMADLNDDDWLDLIFANGAGNIHIFWNRSGGSFEEQVIALDEPTRVIVAADINHDRIRDLVVVTRGETLWMAGLGGGRLADPTPLLMNNAPDVSTFSIAVGDLNADGLVDLYFGNQQTFNEAQGTEAPGPELLMLAGYGEFIDASTLIPPAEKEDLTYLAVLSDLDGDGDLDIYEINDARDFGKETGSENGGNRLLRNDGRTADGGVILTDVTRQSGTGVNVSGMGGGAADVNNDGLNDLFVTVMLPDANALLENQGNLEFIDVTSESNANTMAPEHDVAWGSVFFDANMDGWLDLYVCHGYLETGSDPTQRANLTNQPNAMLLNLGDGTFRDGSAESGVGSDRSSRSPVVGDLNRDGFPDLVVGNVNEAADIYLNGCDDRAWLTVAIDAGSGNLDGVGTTIRVEAAGITQTREIQLGSNSLYGTSAPEAYFGFPEQLSSVNVTIRWPDGVEERFSDIPTRHRLAVRR